MRKVFCLLAIAVSIILIPQISLSQSLFGLSTREEIDIGGKIAKDIEKKLPLYRNLTYQKRLYRIGYRVASASDRKDLDYTFYIIDRDELNAFATFGGHIYIYKGAMDKATDDDELASILAHEIGHVSARHLSKSVEKSRAFGLWFTLLDHFLLRKYKSRKDIHRVINTGYDLIRRGYSREDEFEADRLGVRYSYKAGFNPYGAIRLLNKLKKEQKTQFIDPFRNIGILRTHPYIDERIEAILSEIAATRAEESMRKRFSDSGN